MTYLYTLASEAISAVAHEAEYRSRMRKECTAIKKWGVHLAQGQLFVEPNTTGADVDKWMAASKAGPIIAVARHATCAEANASYKCSTLGLGCSNRSCPCLPDNLGGAANHASAGERPNCRLWPSAMLVRAKGILWFRFNLVLDRFGKFGAHTNLLLDYGPHFGPMREKLTHRRL